VPVRLGIVTVVVTVFVLVPVIVGIVTVVVTVFEALAAVNKAAAHITNLIFALHLLI